MSDTLYVSHLIAIANAEFDRFHDLDEADDDLKARISDYCTGIGIEVPEDISDFAWSATFISWCVKEAGASAAEFKFSARHADFVKAAIANADDKKGVFRGHPIEDYKPKVGDIIHWNRSGGAVSYKQARRSASYPSHSAIVVELAARDGVPCAITIGGNEQNSIRRTVVKLNARGFVNQRERNPFISIIENRKADAMPEALPDRRRGARSRALETATVQPVANCCAGAGSGDAGTRLAEGPAATLVEARFEKPTVDRTSPTPNKNSRRGTDIDHIVLHYTVTGTISSPLNHFKNAAAEVSAHYVIGRDGELVQVVPDGERAWHAGHSQMNDRSIGIEHVALEGQKITGEQSATSIALIRWLMQEYDIPAANVVPHKCFRNTNCCGDLFLDFGGSRNNACATERTAIQKWLRANGIGAGPETDFVAHPLHAEAASPAQRLAMARAIVDYEARRDDRGRIIVFPLPAIDGGGAYEVAGINERYHKRECDELVALIRAGRHADAETRAAEFIAAYTDTAVEWTSNPGLEFYLRDCIFNRGPGGAAWILQKALGVATDMRVGPMTLAAMRAAEADPRSLLDKLRKAREARERLRRDETHPFWRGLVNRWEKAKAKALEFMGAGPEALHNGNAGNHGNAGNFERWSIDAVSAMAGPDDGSARAMGASSRIRMQSAISTIGGDDAGGELVVGLDIPFIGGNAQGRAFADIGRDGYADDPEKMLAGIRQYRNGIAIPDPRVRVEASIGRDNSLPAAFLEVLAKRRRAVGRIATSGIDYINRSGRWVGTGFLVAKNILLTNHHVINSAATARNARIDFNFELSEAELTAGTQVPAAIERKLYALDPTRLFITNRNLDYTFVWIEDGADVAQGVIPIHRASFAVDKDEQAFIVHHPDGKAKRTSLDDADVLKNDASVVTYSSDTLPGSSGSPVFNRQCRLFALHHASREESVQLPDGGTSPFVNEGIKLAAIVTDIEDRVRDGHPDKAMAELILTSVQGSDTQTGFFGQRGRPVVSTDRNAGPETVVDRYKATDADIDVGFWNIEWLANRYTDPDKLREAAFLIVDLGLDIWGLSEVSPPAVKALVAELETRFGERYGYALSEPDASAGKQSTAVIWKQKFVEGVREDWPEEIERLWHLDSRDDIGAEAGFEAIDGRIFPRYPGLFRFTTKPVSGGEPVAFYVVPQHLKAMDEGAKRRKLASILLARAVGLMAKRGGGNLNWIIGGDMNAELASQDFDALTGSGFTAMSAKDEKDGAFSYIEAPNSLIDHIYLSPNLSQRTGAGDFFIVAVDRTVDNYAGKLSDHRPVLVRLSFGKQRQRSVTRPESGGWSDGLIEHLLRGAAAMPDRAGRDIPASRPAARGERDDVAADRGGVRRYERYDARFEASRQPPSYMLFASLWRPLASDLGVPIPNGASDDRIAVAVIDFMHARPHGENLLVMFDAGDPSAPEDFPQRAAARARDIGADLAIYVEGPGGPTDGEWAPDEKQRVRRAGVAVGIAANLDWAQFSRQWDRGKWREYTFKQLAGYKQNGYSACEIDNLDRVIGDADTDADGSKLIGFLQAYGVEHAAGRLPRLILKNISERRLRRVAEAVTDGRLSRRMLAEFHIAEDGTGDPAQQARESEKMAIRTLYSHDTNRYRAHGRYGLEAAFDRLLGADGNGTV